MRCDIWQGAVVVTLFGMLGAHMAWGQSPEAGAPDAPVAEGTGSGAGEGSGTGAGIAPDRPAAAETFAAVVDVERVDDSGGRSPAGGVTVRVFGRDDAVQEAVADDSGRVQLELRTANGPYVARATSDGITFRAGSFLTAATPEATLHLFPVRDDPSAIRAWRIITLVRPHEDFLVFEQYWILNVDAPYVYQAPADDPNAGLDIRLPVGVEGIRVLTPESSEQVVAGDTGVRLRGPIGPVGALDEEGPSLVVNFSLPNESPNHRFAQTLPVAVDQAVLLVPLETEFARLPEIDVELLVPLCGSGTNSAQTVCFEDVNGAGPMALLPGIQRRELWGGRGEAGAVLLFQTRGWPMHADMLTLGAGIAALLVVLGGCFLLWRESRRRREEPSVDAVPVEVLQAERLRLLEALQRAREDHEQGLLPRSELELTDLVIRHRLEVIYDTLGLAPPAPENGSPRATSAPAGRAEAAGPGAERRG